MAKKKKSEKIMVEEQSGGKSVIQSVSAQDAKPPQTVYYSNAVGLHLSESETYLDFKRVSPEAPDPEKAEVLVRIIGTRSLFDALKSLLDNVDVQIKKAASKK